MFAVLSNLLGISKHPGAQTDNFVFRLHYQVTSVIFFSASAILVTSQMFGKPIDCFTHGSQSVEGAYKETVDTLCWVTSIFVVKEHLCGRLGIEVPYAGLGNLTPTNTAIDIHVSYRFLFFILFLQGISFYMPHYIWKSWESRKMKMLSSGLDDPMIDDRKKHSLLHTLTSYLLKGPMNGSIKYALHLNFCELLNLIIVGGNVWVTDYLFGYKFVNYGVKVFAEMFSGNIYSYNIMCDDPVKGLFPQVAKCLQTFVGPSGTMETRDHICVLPLNDFNAHFFKFVWIWYAILLIVSMFWLLLRVVTFVSCKLRTRLLSMRAGILPVSSVHIHDGDRCCKVICSRMSYADWIILMQLGKNVDPLTYKQFLEGLCSHLRMRELGKQQHLQSIHDKSYYSPV